jgi:CheY-like chemotaxis protein
MTVDIRFRRTLVSAHNLLTYAHMPIMNKASPRSGTRLRPARVLIIDHDTYVAKALALLLSDMSEVVVEGRSPHALKRLLAGERYDVVLCDVMMPEMNGMQLYLRLRPVLPQEAARLVFMTGGEYRTELRAFLDGVPNTCIEKPFDMPALRDLIERRVRSPAARRSQSVI